jgi:hypothetical protein
MRGNRRLLIGSGIFAAAYVVLYFINAGFGGYDPYYTSDGRRRYDGGPLVHDCLMWQPRFGSYYNEGRHDLVGLTFYPLLQLDHRFIHKTHSIADGDFLNWWASVTVADIHPRYRSDYLSWQREKPKK